MITISVILPSYKMSADIIERAINSIIHQKFQPYEIIIIDDNGYDKYTKISCDFAKKMGNKIKLIYNKKNKGANYSRNKGILEAKGDYVAFIDADDVWLDNYLEQVVCLIKKQKAKFITSNYQIVHREGILPPAFNQKDFISGNIYKKELYKDCVGPTSTVVVCKQTLIKAGLFDEQLPARQDYDMWLRVLKIVPLYYNFTPSVLVYRDGHISISSSYKRNVIGTKIVMDKILNNNNLTNKEINRIKASHYKHMALACILCNEYKESRKYSILSLKFNFNCTVLGWYFLSFFSRLFTFLRQTRKKILYKL